jgi:hypothetical protein
MYSLSWILEKPSRDALKNGTHKKLLKWDEIKNPNKKYYNIILGSSRGYCSYNPIIIDNIEKNTTFNMCTASQNITETYYILKEILKYQKPKTIIYEIYLPSFINEPDFYSIMSNASFMSNKGKWGMILGFGKKGLLNILNPLLKHKPYFRQDIKKIFKPKSPVSDSRYWEKGYLHDNTVVDSIQANNFGPINPTNINDLQLAAIASDLGLIIELCDKKDIDLICVRAPYPKTRLNKTLTDTVSIFFKGFLNKNKTPFFDFNYLSDSNYYDSDFIDSHHMNDKGASKVSKQLGVILKKRIHNNVYKKSI